MSERDLKPRALPAQARSRATVDLLLETTLELLEDVGAERFNTNLLAERAGVSVRAIYRYFPNKIAVLVALAERTGEWERAWIGDLSQAPPEGGLRETVRHAIYGYYRAASAKRGVVALRAAMQVIPELRAVEDAASARQQADLAKGLARLGLKGSPERLAAISQTMIEAASRLLDVALFSPPERAELLLDEMTRMLTAYLVAEVAPHDR